MSLLLMFIRESSQLDSLHYLFFQEEQQTNQNSIAKVINKTPDA
jgi:hypothetical protein